MQKRQKVIVLLVFLIAIGGAAFFLWQKHTPTAVLELSGNVDIREVRMAFRVSGRVQQILVDEGDEVIEAGQVLAVLDPEPFENMLRESQANLMLAQANLDLLESGYREEDVAQALAVLQAKQAQFKSAEQMLTRQKGLAGTGAVPPSVLDDAYAARNSAFNEAEAARQNYEALKKGFRDEEITQAQAQVALAQARVDAAQLQLKDTHLVAPSTGVLLTRAIEVGSMVSAGSSALTISLNEPVWIRAYVEEPYLGEVTPGRRVNVYTDTPNGPVYEGIIGFVSPTAEFTPKQVQTQDLRTGLVYRLRVIVQNPDSKLRQGMPVTVKLLEK